MKADTVPRVCFEEAPARKNKTIVIEGDWAYPGTVIMHFPSIEAAQAWCDDPEYQALAEHRHRSARANLVIVEGMSDQNP